MVGGVRLQEVLLLLHSRRLCPQGTVKRTLSEFRRTHQDNWQQHRQSFTAEQLLVLTDLLVSPCYYA